MAKKEKRHHRRKTAVPVDSGSLTVTKSATDETIPRALALYDQGDFRNAKRILLKLLGKDPLRVEVRYHLGTIAKAQGKYNEAIDYYAKVIFSDPGYVNAYFNLGGIFIEQGLYEKAGDNFQKVVDLSPDYANAWYNLGIVAGAQGKAEEALRYYEKVLCIDPRYINAYYNSGWVLLNSRQYDESIAYFEKVVSLDPCYADALFNIGTALQGKQEYDAAIAYYEKTLAVKPDYCQVYNNLGVIYQSQHDLGKALAYYEKAIGLKPEAADAYMNMANIFRERGEVDKTIEFYKKSLSLKPSLVALNNLCGYQKEQCNYDEVHDLTVKMLEYEDLNKHDLATIHDTFIQLCEWQRASDIIPRFKRAELEPECRDVLAGSFMEFCATEDVSLDEIAELHKLWGGLTEERVVPFEHEARKEGYREKKKIRIGYSSPDFREHSVGYLIKDIIASHNREKLEIYCYANFDQKDSDAFTHEIIQACDAFKYVKHLSDREVAEQIFHDEIAILIDLAGHTAGHRLRSLAYKPAPIQITYLGYPNTTGLFRVDYRITDQFAESGEENDYRYTERLMRLTNCFLSFRGFKGLPPEAVERATRGQVRLGCFNNIQKLTPQAIKLWADILNGVENSILYLKAKQLNTRLVWDNIVKEFSKHGIAEDRVKCLGYTITREEHLRLYNEIDIALDTFPYNGTVTTLEALWMNVPVITLVGESHPQRVGYSILKNLNLDELIATSGENYVMKGVHLAKDKEALRELKGVIRSRLLASSICNPKVITREMELHYRRIWTEYLAAGAAERKPAEQSAESGVSMKSAITAVGRVRMAMVKLEAGRFEEAIEICSKLVDSSETSPLAQYVLGVALHRLERDTEAIEALEMSLMQRQDNPGAWKLLGELYLVQNDVGKANICLEKIATIQKQSQCLDAHTP